MCHSAAFENAQTRGTVTSSQGERSWISPIEAATTPRPSREGKARWAQGEYQEGNEATQRWRRLSRASSESGSVGRTCPTSIAAYQEGGFEPYGPRVTTSRPYPNVGAASVAVDAVTLRK